MKTWILTFCLTSVLLLSGCGGSTTNISENGKQFKTTINTTSQDTKNDNKQKQVLQNEPVLTLIKPRENDIIKEGKIYVEGKITGTHDFSHKVMVRLLWGWGKYPLAKGAIDLVYLPIQSDGTFQGYLNVPNVSLENKKDVQFVVNAGYFNYPNSPYSPIMDMVTLRR